MPLTLAEVGKELTIKRIGGREDTRKFLENLGFVVGGITAWYELVVDAFFALVRGACSGISRVAVAADAGAAGCFPQKKRLCECHLYFLCRQLGRSPDRGGESLRGVGEV